MIASLWVWAEPDKLVTLDSIAACLAFEEVTYPANAVSFSVSTLLINVTISAKESLSAWDPVRIASILPFSVSILPSNDVSIATLCECADPDRELISDERPDSIATLCVCAEEDRAESAAW